jgi:N6-adenosine-specific RNA methylase IME4
MSATDIDAALETAARTSRPMPSHENDPGAGGVEAGTQASIGRGATRSMRVADIIVGRRHRTDIGDIEGLAGSISDIGLLHPIVVRADGTLIAGMRRLEAVKKLGWEHVSVTVVELAEIVRGEHAENVERKDFTLTEAVAVKRALEPLEAAAAKKRQGTRTYKHGGKLPPRSVGKTRDKVAKFTGFGARTLEKAEAVVVAAEVDPEKFGKLKQDMDRTGRVDGAFKRLKIIQQAEAIRAESPPLPGNGPYRVIVADPPWPHEKRTEDPSHRGTCSYPRMSISKICETDVGSLAHQDCILWLWVTNQHLREAFAVLDAWGFKQKTMLTWAKDKMGTGDWLRGQTEHCLMAIRGSPTIVLKNHTTLLRAPRRAHSEKPHEFYALVESLCPAPRYAYLWSRMARDRWDGHGDEYPGRRNAPNPQALVGVVEQLPRVAAEVDAAEHNRKLTGRDCEGLPSELSEGLDDGLDIPEFLDRRKKRSTSRETSADDSEFKARRRRA